MILVSLQKRHRWIQLKLGQESHDFNRGRNAPLLVQ